MNGYAMLETRHYTAPQAAVLCGSTNIFVSAEVCGYLAEGFTFDCGLSRRYLRGLSGVYAVSYGSVRLYNPAFTLYTVYRFAVVEPKETRLEPHQCERGIGEASSLQGRI